MAELFDDDHPSYVSDIVQRCVNHPKATHQLVCTACLGQEEVAGSAVDNARLDAQVARLYAVRLLIENGDLPDALREIQQAIDVFEETAPPEGRQPDGFPVLTAQEIADWRECHDAIERRAEGRQEPEDAHSTCHDLVCNASREYPRGARGVGCSCRGRDARAAEKSRENANSHPTDTAEGRAPTETPQTTEAHAILDSVQRALRGEAVSEFEASFPVVRLALDAVTERPALSTPPETPERLCAELQVFVDRLAASQIALTPEQAKVLRELSLEDESVPRTPEEITKFRAQCRDDAWRWPPNGQG